MIQTAESSAVPSPTLVVRPALPADVEGLYRLAEAAGPGMTNLQADRGVLADRLSASAAALSSEEVRASGAPIHDLQDLVKKIAMKEKIEESREFAGDVQASLYGGLALNNAGIRNRGIKKAPFIVLIGANMPSILAEISFVSNPTDERKLETSEHRQRIAESLYRGVSRYVSGLSGVKVASKIDKPEGQ